MKKLLASVATLATLALPAQALDLSAMNAAERDAFGQAVRSYLLENPESSSKPMSCISSNRLSWKRPMINCWSVSWHRALFEDDRDFEAATPKATS